MNNIFDIKRVGLVLKIDWIEHKKLFLISAGLLLAAYLLFMWYDFTDNRVNLFWVGITIFLLSYLSYVGKKVHFSKGLWLTLPASALEKFVALLIYGFFYVGVFILVYWLSAGVAYWFNNVPMVSLEELSYPMRGFGVITFHTAYFFLGYVLFRKYALGIAIAVEALVIGLFARLLFYTIKGPLADINSGTRTYETIENILYFLGDHYNTILYVFSILLFYAAYVRLKKMQIR